MEFTAEHRLILELLKFHHIDRNTVASLTREKLDWAEVLGHLVYNRVAGIAWHVLNEAGISSFNREAELGLSMVYQYQRARTLKYQKYLLEISDHLKRNGIRHAFLKGSLLAHTVYPPGCRISTDFDVLVDADDLSAINKILTDLGYIQGEYQKQTKTVKPASRVQIINHRMNFGEVYPYCKTVDESEIDYVEIDLNFSLDWKAKGIGDRVRNFLESAEEYEIAPGRTIYSLNKEYFLAHLCVHLYKEAIGKHWVDRQRDLGLYKFADLYAFLTDGKWSVDYGKLYRIAEENELKNACYYALEFARQLFEPLNDHEDFLRFLEAVKPENTDYLDEVADLENHRVYRWEHPFMRRVFQLKRTEYLKPTAELAVREPSL